MAKMTYTEWMAKVNLCLLKICGMDADWLPDYCYYDSWKAGDTPLECAREALENAKTF